LILYNALSRICGTPVPHITMEKRGSKTQLKADRDSVFTSSKPSLVGVGSDASI